MPIDPDDFLAEGQAFIDSLKTAPRNGTRRTGDGTGGKWDQLYSLHGEGGGAYGGRNNALLQLVAFFRAKSFPYPLALALAKDWDKAYCDPPQGEELVEDLFSRQWVKWEEGEKPDAKPEDFGPPKPEQRKSFLERVIRFKDVPFPPSELPYLWGPYLNKGAAHWMTARTGLGKSTWTYNVACAMAEGRELWGVECLPTRVLYCDLESGGIGRSLKVQRLYHDQRPDIPLDFIEALSLPLEMREFLAFVKGEAYEFVIFDTARRCFSVKDENDNAEFYNRVLPTLDSLKELSIASLTLGHPPKNGALGARGAGAQEDAGDVNLTLTMHKGEITDKDATVKLAITKNRLLGLEHAPLFLQRTGEDQFMKVDAGDAVEAHLTLMRKVERYQQAVAELTRVGQTVSQRAVATQARMSLRDAGEAKKYLEDPGD